MEHLHSVLKNKIVKVMLLLLLILLGIFYTFVFMSKGIYYDNAFLKETQTSEGRFYIGNTSYGQIKFIVAGTKNQDEKVEVTCFLPNDLQQAFSVTFAPQEYWNTDVVTVTNERNEIIFDGQYKKGDPFLYDKQGVPLLDSLQLDIRTNLDSKNPYTSDYQMPTLSVIQFATGDNVTIRGDIRYFIFAMLLLFFLLVDIKYPLFFFSLKHGWHVQDPEPNEFYLTIQRASWYVMPFIILILLGIAVF